MVLLQEYNLPDKSLLALEESRVLTWIPDKIYVVIGQRDKPETSVNLPFCNLQGAEVLQRPSGGHAVVLTPKTIVIAMLHGNRKLSDIKKIFALSNNIIIDALEKQEVKGCEVKGVSDISINNLKIAGSSMFFAKTKLFFHAVLNISECPEYISQFLHHPASEPEYRKNRKHHEFITSLVTQGYNINIEKLQSDILESFEKFGK